MTVRAVQTTLLALVLVCAAVAATGGATGGIVLFDAPRGAWLGELREDAALTVLETRDGWRHVRIEGWVAGPSSQSGASEAAPAPSQPQTTSPESTPGVAPTSAAGPARGPAVVRGVLAPPLGSAGGMGAGVLVLLVDESAVLEQAHNSAGEECRKQLIKKDKQMEATQAEVNRALNSSDNFREAANRNDQLKARLAAEKRERADLIRDCRARALKVFEGSVAQRALSDGSGRFEFEGVAPGHYQVVAFEAAGDNPRSWCFAFVVEGGGSRVLDPLTDTAPVAADWGLR